MPESNFPIRVGGVYRSRASNLNRRVISIDGDMIVNATVYASIGSEAMPHSQTADSFRQIHFPEDISPIPALLAFIEKVAEAGERGEFRPGVYLSDEARELLASQKVLP